MACAFILRVLRLCWFGLIEEARSAASDWSSSLMFRKMPLYDRTLSFALT